MAAANHHRRLRASREGRERGRARERPRVRARARGATTTAPSGDARLPNPAGRVRGCVPCAPCQAAKPPGAHHCSTCRQCVQAMDHHSSVRGELRVGADTMRHFLLFVGYVALGNCAGRRRCVAPRALVHGALQERPRVGSRAWSPRRSTLAPDWVGWWGDVPRTPTRAGDSTTMRRDLAFVLGHAPRRRRGLTFVESLEGANKRHPRRRRDAFRTAGPRLRFRKRVARSASRNRFFKSLLNRPSARALRWYATASIASLGCAKNRARAGRE